MENGAGQPKKTYKEKSFSAGITTEIKRVQGGRNSELTASIAGGERHAD